MSRDSTIGMWNCQSPTVSDEVGWHKQPENQSVQTHDTIHLRPLISMDLKASEQKWTSFYENESGSFLGSRRPRCSKGVGKLGTKALLLSQHLGPTSRGRGGLWRLSINCFGLLSSITQIYLKYSSEIKKDWLHMIKILGFLWEN